MLSIYSLRGEFKRRQVIWDTRGAVVLAHYRFTTTGSGRRGDQSEAELRHVERDTTANSSLDSRSGVTLGVKRVARRFLGHPPIRRKVFDSTGSRSGTRDFGSTIAHPSTVLTQAAQRPGIEQQGGDTCRGASPGPVQCIPADAQQ
jgi:hypothetical protein